MSHTPASSLRPRRLKLDSKYGAAPHPKAKYRSAAHFRIMQCTYQWTQGFHLACALDRPDQMRLVCATATATCPFSITAEYTTNFTDDPELIGKSGFRIATEPYCPEHNHPRPYERLDLDAENARRATLPADHPSLDLDSPPLKPSPFFSSAAAATPLAHTPLGHFLLEISPAFAPHLPAFAAHGIPLSTDPALLVELDTGRPDDDEVFRTFRDVKPLSPFLVALAADGIRKAKQRQSAAQPPSMAATGEEGVGPAPPLDPRIAVGLHRLHAERWVRQKIAEGQATATAAAAPDRP